MALAALALVLFGAYDSYPVCVRVLYLTNLFPPSDLSPYTLHLTLGTDAKVVIMKLRSGHVQPAESVILFWQVLGKGRRAIKKEMDLETKQIECSRTKLRDIKHILPERLISIHHGVSVLFIWLVTAPYFLTRSIPFLSQLIYRSFSKSYHLHIATICLAPFCRSFLFYEVY